MKTIKVLGVALALTIIFAGVFGTEAMSYGRHHGGGLFALKTLLELNLSDSQKTQILGIFGKYDLKTAWQNVREAQKNLRAAMQATSLDETSYITGITSAYNQVAPLRQQLFLMRAQMMYEIKAVLSASQLQQLQQHRKGSGSGSPTTTTPGP